MSRTLVKRLSRLVSLIVCCCLSPFAHPAASATSARQTIVAAILAEDDAKKAAILATLAGGGDEGIATLLGAWRADGLFIYSPPDGSKIAVQLIGAKGE